MLDSTVPRTWHATRSNARVEGVRPGKQTSSSKVGMKQTVTEEEEADLKQSALPRRSFPQLRENGLR